MLPATKTALAALLVALATSVILAQGSRFDGTWELDLARSQNVSGIAKQMLWLLTKATSAPSDGHPGHQRQTSPPRRGPPSSTARNTRFTTCCTRKTIARWSCGQIDAYTDEREIRSDGRLIATIRRVVSADGTTLTSTDSAGVVRVFRKQE